MRAILITFVLCVFATQPANAWLCPQLSQDKQFTDADIVVSALVLNTELARDHSKNHWGHRFVETDFLVKRTWKGQASNEIRVKHPPEGTAFGINFAYGENVVLFANGSGDRFSTSYCAGDLNGADPEFVEPVLHFLATKENHRVYEFEVTE